VGVSGEGIVDVVRVSVVGVSVIADLYISCQSDVSCGHCTHWLFTLQFLSLPV